MSNTVSGVEVNTVREMMIFDHLPTNIQKIIRNQPLDLHVEPIAKFYVMMRQRGSSMQYIEYEVRQLCCRSCGGL